MTARLRTTGDYAFLTRLGVPFERHVIQPTGRTDNSRQLYGYFYFVGQENLDGSFRARAKQGDALEFQQRINGIWVTLFDANTVASCCDDDGTKSPI